MTRDSKVRRYAGVCFALYAQLCNPQPAPLKLPVTCPDLKPVGPVEGVGVGIVVVVAICVACPECCLVAGPVLAF